MFATEHEMSLKFEKFLKANFGNAYIKECTGLFGVPDYVYFAKQDEEVSIISFELKLNNWRRAAKQAFRYKSFSNISYVVLSRKYVNPAINNIDFFKRYNIGLAAFDIQNEFEIFYKPETVEPFSENLNQKLIDFINKNNKKTKNITSIIRSAVEC